MPTTISAVTDTNRIAHGLFLDLTIGNTTYYISNIYKPLAIGLNTYIPQGAFLSVGDIRDDLKATQGDIAISLSGIPNSPDYMSLVLTEPVKGGTIVIRRAFFDLDTYELITGEVYERYRGVITNFAIDENTNVLNGEQTNTVALSCASINTVLKNRISGQRTNPSDRNKFYPSDISFDRVPTLMNANFDFGKEFASGAGVGGGGRAGLGPGVDSQLR